MKRIERLVILALLFAPLPALAQEHVVVTVKGMVCSFCAQGLKKTFKKKSEVEKIEIDLEGKTVTIDFAAGKNLDDKELDELIRDSGYDVLRIDRGGSHG